MADILKGVDSSKGPSFSLANRSLRLIWCIVYVLLFRPTPVFLHAWRVFLLRCFGAKLGRGCHIYPDARIWAPWNLDFGDYVGIANGVICYSMATIKVGESVVISQRANLCTGTHNYTSPFFQLYAKPISINAKAWIAQEAFICPGITIGEGAVIGARSVVTKDMPPWMVCAGNPCNPIKPRKIKKP